MTAKPEEQKVARHLLVELENGSGCTKYSQTIGHRIQTTKESTHRWCQHTVIVVVGDYNIQHCYA